VTEVAQESNGKHIVLFPW